MRKLLIIAATITLISSCSLYQKFKTPQVEQENLVGENVQTDDTLSVLPAWQEMFADEQLRQLITKALETNSDLRIARMNIEQAEAMLTASKLAFVPAFAISPEGGLSITGQGNSGYSYQLPLTMQWEIDLFGKLRNSKEQARASLFQTEEYVHLVQTQLIASVANSYYTLIMLDEQLRITRESTLIQKKNLDVIIAMKEAGLQTETAVNQATAEYYNIQTTAIDLEKQIREVENGLALLINETPHSMPRTSMQEAGTINIDHTQPIPLLVLANRPDVKQAEFGLQKSFYGINVARSAFYPSINLMGSAGWSSTNGAIFDPMSMLFSAIGSLTQPLFSRGVNRANLKVAKLQYEQSLITFEKSLLVAGSEVNNALISCQNSTNKHALRLKQVEANEKALINSTAMMQHSSATYLEIIMAQGSLLQAQLMQVGDWFEGIQGQINLYKALGGGVK